MRIHIYAENCTQKGQIAALDLTDEQVEEQFGADVFTWGEGTEQELIEQALKRLSTRNDKRPGGMMDHFDWKCARQVLEHLDGPEVEFDEESMTFRVVSEEE